MTRVTPPEPQSVADTNPDAQRFDAEADDDDDIAPGTMVGEYRVEHRIGKGGMGIVFAAVHPLIGKRVAIKVLRNEVCKDSVAVERFIDEARVVNQIEHPNIVDIFAFGQLPDGRNYFVMEWLRGESLRMRMDRAPLALMQACEILRTLARALAAAHELGIVHRDLKPDNVFLVDIRREQMTVKLLDFGVAKLIQKEQRPKRVEHTATGTIVGTPQYLSPEQAKGYQVDHRADIYALGGIAFELITGQPPFAADNVMEMVAKHLMEAPALPSSFIPNLPPAMDELVVAMLAKDPDDRPSLSEILVTLDRVEAQHETDSQPRIAQTFAIATPPFGSPAQQTPTPVSTPPPLAPRSRRRWVVAAIAVTAIAVGAVVFANTRGTRDEVPPIAPPSPTVVTLPAPTPAPAPAPSTAAAPAPAPISTPVPPASPFKAAPVRPPAKHHAGAGSGSDATHNSDVAPATPHPDDDNDLLAPGSLPPIDAGSAS